MADDQSNSTPPAQPAQPAPTTQSATPVQQPTQQADPSQTDPPFVHPSLGTLMIKGAEVIPGIRADGNDVKHG